MEEFFSQYPDAGTGQLNREQALETVRFNIRWVEAYATVIEEWLASSSSLWLVIHPNTTCWIYHTDSLPISHLGLIHIVFKMNEAVHQSAVFIWTWLSTVTFLMLYDATPFLFFPGFIFAQFEIIHSVLYLLSFVTVRWSYKLLE